MFYLLPLIAMQIKPSDMILSTRILSEKAAKKEEQDAFASAIMGEVDLEEEEGKDNDHS